MTRGFRQDDDVVMVTDQVSRVIHPVYVSAYPASSAGLLATVRGGAALLLVMLVCGMASPAQAHTGFQSGSPAPRDHLHELPTQVQLHFGQPSIPDDRTRLVVLSPTGANLAEGPVYLTALGVATKLAPAHESGRYSVSFAVVSVDGHLTEGHYPFWVTPGTAVSSASGHSIGDRLPWYVGGLGVIVVLAVLKGRNRSHRGTARRAEMRQ